MMHDTTTLLNTSKANATTTDGLTVNALSCRRNDRKLFQDITFNLHPGQLLQISGANGAGKTTLLRTIAGLIPAQSGVISWYGQAIESPMSNYRQQLCYIGHQLGLKTSLTAVENLQSQLALYGRPNTKDFIHALDRLGVKQYADIPIERLSAGQQRRVALAKLLLTKAKLWILDEPFTALDTPAVTCMYTIIQAHLTHDGMVLLTSHQAFKLPEQSHEVLVL